MSKPISTTCNQRFADIHGLKIGQVKYLKGLISKYARCWVDWNNNAGRATPIRAQQLKNMERRAWENADAYAKKLGFEPDWGVGLWPTLRKDGTDYHLPD